MTTQDSNRDRVTLLQGTLDLLILRTLLAGAQHGQGVARAIQRTSRDALLVDHGSLYPALQRLEANGWVRASWGISDNNRRARYYELTALGTRQLSREESRWRRMVDAVALILAPTPGGGA